MIKKNFQPRKIISLVMMSVFLVVGISGVLMYFRAHSQPVSLVHTVLGFTLLLAGLWHIRNNFSALKKYMQGQTQLGAIAISRAFIAVLLVSSALVLGSLLGWSPFVQVYELGNRLRAGQPNPVENVVYEHLQMQGDKTGFMFELDLRKGPYFQYPTYAFWLETEAGAFIRPIYVTRKLAQNDFFVRAYKNENGWQFDDEPQSKSTRWRPESLPVFLHRAGLVAHAGAAQPESNQPVADAYTGATMLNSFTLTSSLALPASRRFKILFEINHSFDFNEFYSEDRFPDDPVYSGNGYSAQPSLIYAADIDLNRDENFVELRLQGRGHHSGQDGDIHRDMDNMTTALELVDRIIVDLRQLKAGGQ